MPGTLTANVRWILKSAAFRDRALQVLPAALAGSGITWSVTDSPEEGELGLPRWTIVIFHAQHGDIAWLDRNVEYRIEQHAELGGYLERLTAEHPW
jgi:hypothetical protein